MPRAWPLRRLLRWTSLVALVVVLAVLGTAGTARTHQQNFVLFLGIVLGLAVAVVAVFVATAGDDETSP